MGKSSLTGRLYQSEWESSEGPGPLASRQAGFLERRHNHLGTAPRAWHDSPLCPLRDSPCENCPSPSS